MNRNSSRIALSGMMAALGTAIMLLGGVIPAASFSAVALAGLTLIPVYLDGGRAMALSAWVAISALSLILCPDKEAALLFAFLGWYPVAKWRLDRWGRPWPRRLVKLALWNLCAGAMYALVFFVLRLDAIMADYQDMTRAMLIAFILLGNFVLVVYDRLLGIMAILYLKKLRPKLGRGR